MKNMNALINEEINLQEFEIDQLKAQIAYLEGGSKSANNLQMIAELKDELAEAIIYYESLKEVA